MTTDRERIHRHPRLVRQADVPVVPVRRVPVVRARAAHAARRAGRARARARARRDRGLAAHAHVRGRSGPDACVRVEQEERLQAEGKSNCQYQRPSLSLARVSTNRCHPSRCCTDHPNQPILWKGIDQLTMVTNTKHRAKPDAMHVFAEQKDVYKQKETNKLILF